MCALVTVVQTCALPISLGTGYVGYCDADVFRYICDRLSDMVISGGVNIYPAEIEAALITLPGVADCAVIGVPNAEFGESVAACIQPAQDRKSTRLNSSH